MKKDDISYETVRNNLTYLDDEDIKLIDKAYHFAKEKHDGQRRRTGEPYIIHPLNVAYILTTIKADKETICAGLLHDTLEDTDTSMDEMEKEFGKEITKLVDGVTKINNINISTENEYLTSYYKKIIVGMSEDVRVIIVKLADRLHNMRTLYALPVEKQKKKAKETLEILAPIAHRLGMHKIKSELEDLSLKYLKPEIYFDIAEKLNTTKVERDSYVNNMMDEVRENGGTIRINELENTLGIPVVPISAAKNEGINELIEHAVHVARYDECPGRLDFCDANAENGLAAVHRGIHAVVHLIEDHAAKAKIPVRFAATKLMEGDKLIMTQLALDENEKELLEHIISEMENECGKDREAALADMRFNFIEKVCSSTVVKPVESKAHARSVKIDRFLTGKYTALPAFAGIMALVFWLTFGVIGAGLSDLLSMAIDWFTGVCDAGLTAFGINPVVHSLVIDGIFAGVGSVLSFLPVIVVLFFFLSILEDSGYMARIAFVMDKLLRKIGLSGRSFVPMLIGFGCSVPAIMSTRTLASERDRKMTILLTPFMSCSAKLPIYALFTYAFFPKYKVLVMIGLYFTGIITGILYALILKKTAFKGEPVPFVMELPNYRLPSPKSVMQLIWEKAKDFITKAFTIIFLATIVIWFLQTFDVRLNVVTDSKDSLLALIGGLIAPVFAPLGFNDWRISTALITGFTAKESVVSTLTVLLGGDTALLGTMFSTKTALVFLVFTLLYTPCVAAIASVRREMGTKKAAFMVAAIQCLIAWSVAFLVHLVLKLI